MGAFARKTGWIFFALLAIVGGSREEPA
jgi:hypothetical protein